VQKTVIVLGCYRGGTSMVTAVLKSLGVFMGTRFGKESGGSNHEDLQFQGKNTETIRSMIKKRNEQNDVWGWKDPGLIFRIGEIEDDLRNPHFITIFRDPYAIALSEFHRNHRPLMEGLKTALGHTQALVMFHERTMNPNHLISYEKAMNDKATFVKNLVDFLGLDVSAKAMADAEEVMTYGGYTQA